MPKIIPPPSNPGIPQPQPVGNVIPPHEAPHIRAQAMAQNRPTPPPENPHLAVTGNFPQWYKDDMKQIQQRFGMLNAFEQPILNSIQYDKSSNTISPGKKQPSVAEIQNFLNTSGIQAPRTFIGRDGQPVTTGMNFNANQIYNDIGSGMAKQQAAAEQLKKAHEIYLSKQHGGLGSFIAGLGGLATGAGFGMGFGTFGGPSLINSAISHSNGSFFAAGGAANHRMPATHHGEFHAGGLLNGHTPGRADKIKTKVPNGSHIIPADIVSGMGQGNTLAGSKVLEKLFPMGKHPKASLAQAALPGLASGGGVPVYLSDGEYAITPETVREIGGGDMEHGHEILDHFIVSMRKKIVEKMKKLPGPAKR